MKWQIKAALQTGFSLMPFGERLNYAAQYLAGSHSPEQLYTSFVKHRDVVRGIKARAGLADFTAVELGTGWTGIGIVALALEGAREIHSFDAVRHLRFPLVANVLRQIQIREPRYRSQRLLDAGTAEEFLSLARATYHAPADAGRTGLPSRSVDLIYSQDVLEHIPVAALEAITRESARICRGVACHGIGLHDHLSQADPSISGIHFLSHSPIVWKLINNRISYHNRLRAKHFMDLFARHGGSIVHCEQTIRPQDIQAAKSLPLRLHADLTLEELAVTRLHVDVTFDRAIGAEGDRPA